MGLKKTTDDDAQFSLAALQAMAAELMAEDPTIAASMEDGPPVKEKKKKIERARSKEKEPEPAKEKSLNRSRGPSPAREGRDSITADSGGNYSPSNIASRLAAAERPATGSIRSRRDLENGDSSGPPPPAPILRTSTMISTTSKYGSMRGGIAMNRIASVDVRQEQEASSRETSFLANGKLSRMVTSENAIPLDSSITGRGGRDGPSPPTSLRRLKAPGNRLSTAGSNESSPKPWGQGAPSSRFALTGSDVSSDVLTVESSDESFGISGVANVKGRQQADPNDRSSFQKAEEMYSLQAAVALRLIADAEMAEETELVNPSAAAASSGGDLMWAAPSMPRSQAEATAYRFWVNGCLSYEDRIEDGFYDIWGMQPYVYAMAAEPSERGRMPPLDALRSLSPSEAAFDVTIINRTIDADLRDLENEAVNLAYAATEVQTLAQKLGVLVATHLGGAINSEPNDLIPRFRQRGWEIKSYIKSIVLPMGRLTAGVCRHRALLFKVLADALDMPCRVQRGCKSCGMDDGAHCLVLASDEKEYVVDLIQKPGTLLAIEPSGEAAATAAAGTSLATDMHALMGGLKSSFISSPLRCPVVKSLALTDPADGAAWMPDFRRAPNVDEQEAQFGSRRRFGRKENQRERERVRRKKGQKDDDDDDDDSDDEEVAPKKGGKKGKAKDGPGSASKAAAAAAATPAAADSDATEEKGAELMDVLMDGRIMDIGEAEIAWEDIELGERVGAGSFGTVYRGEWAGSDVAVKVLINQDLQEEQLLEFKREVIIMQRLRHPNIVLFMGAVTKPPNLSIITEFLSRGSLFRLLHRPQAKDALKEDRRMRMAMDIARGINYLHHCNPMIVHRDLKTPNLLVDKNFSVKLADFGLSRNKNSTFLSSKSGAGTPEWMAPEVLRNEQSDEKSDVYSFGVILWELATLQQPWDGMNPMQVVGAVGFQNQRLTIPPDMDSSLTELMLDCWHNDPTTRPNFDVIMARLKPIAQKAAAGKTLFPPSAAAE